MEQQTSLTSLLSEFERGNFTSADVRSLSKAELQKKLGELQSMIDGAERSPEGEKKLVSMEAAKDLQTLLLETMTLAVHQHGLTSLDRMSGRPLQKTDVPNSRIEKFPSAPRTEKRNETVRSTAPSLKGKSDFQQFLDREDPLKKSRGFFGTLTMRLRHFFENFGDYANERATKGGVWGSILSFLGFGSKTKGTTVQPRVPPQKESEPEKKKSVPERKEATKDVPPPIEAPKKEEVKKGSEKASSEEKDGVGAPLKKENSKEQAKKEKEVPKKEEKAEDAEKVKDAEVKVILTAIDTLLKEKAAKFNDIEVKVADAYLHTLTIDGQEYKLIKDDVFLGLGAPIPGKNLGDIIDKMKKEGNLPSMTLEGENVVLKAGKNTILFSKKSLLEVLKKVIDEHRVKKNPINIKFSYTHLKEGKKTEKNISVTLKRN